jgi:peptidoglycan hydrolase-like protein with peptidoglycan-binding domain
MSTSYNGWPASRDPAKIGVDPNFKVAGHKFPGGMKKGDVSTVMRFYLGNYHLRVESLNASAGDEWGYVYRPNVNNPSVLSCHSSATAADANAQKHPNGRRNTLSSFQVAQLRKIQGWVKKVIRWGGDFSKTPDEMHHEINASAAAVHAVAVMLNKPRFTKVLKVGVGSKAHPDAEVKKLQTWLGIPADGVFGTGTETAVKRTQYKLGMTKTGQVTNLLGFYVNP